MKIPFLVQSPRVRTWNSIQVPQFHRKAYYQKGSFRATMANLNVAVLGPLGYAKDLGKKGTVSDITFYNLKRGEDTVTFIEPTRYPERLAPLFFATSLASKVLLVVEKIDATFGEVVIMLQCQGIKDGYIVLRNYLTPEQLAPLIKDSCIEGYEFVEDDAIALREKILEDTNKLDSEPPSDQKSGTIPVDHFFNVRGIGTVILGSVTSGVIRKHDALRVLPGDRTAQVRSIQKHDDDFDWAVPGDRAGIALKNIDAEDLDRGAVLTNDESIKAESSLEARAELTRYWSLPMKTGMVLHIGHWMQFVPAKVISVEDEGDFRNPILGLELEKPMVYMPGDSAVIHYLEGEKLKVVGTLKLP